jgi:hypothetical protein
MRTSFAPLALDAVEFLSEQTGIDFGFEDFTDPRWLCCTVRDDHGAIGAVVACEFKTWFDAHFNAAVEPRLMTREVKDRALPVIFSTLFSQAVRVTAHIAPDNRLAIAGARRMGFIYEGFLRMGVEGKRDALIFGMLRADCRLIGRTNDHGENGSLAGRERALRQLSAGREWGVPRGLLDA